MWFSSGVSFHIRLFFCSADFSACQPAKSQSRKEAGPPSEYIDPQKKKRNVQFPFSAPVHRGRGLPPPPPFQNTPFRITQYPPPPQVIDITYCRTDGLHAGESACNSVEFIFCVGETKKRHVRSIREMKCLMLHSRVKKGGGEKTDSRSEKHRSR